MDWETPVAVLLWMVVAVVTLFMIFGVTALTFIWGSGLYAMHQERRARKARARQ